MINTITKTDNTDKKEKTYARSKEERDERQRAKAMVKPLARICNTDFCFYE